MNTVTKIAIMSLFVIAASSPSSAATMSKEEYVANCSSGKRGGPPQSKEICSCFYDKVTNEASENAMAANLLGAGEGQSNQSINSPELIAEVFRFMQECGFRG